MGPALLVLAIFVLWCSTVVAVGIHPDIQQKLVDEGRWDRTKELLRAARDAGMDAGAERVASLAAGAQGTPFASRIPCILVEFSDNPWSSGVNTSVGRIDSMLFSDHQFVTGSMHDYYLENSYGAFDIEGIVVGPVMMPRPYAAYIRGKMGIQSDTANSRTLVHDAVIAADHLVDFSQFDANNDGIVDGVMIVCAGPGFDETGDTSRIQSHSWNLPLYLLVGADGKTISDFTIQSEEHGPGIGGTNGIGVFCHEWGHILGLIDLYDVDYSSWGIGDWSIMGSGNYLNHSNTPCHFDPWSKIRLGWAQVDTVQSNRVNQPIPAYAGSPKVFRLWLSGLGGREYFLLCNRKNTGFDSRLPGSGLMILHIDTAMSDNSREYRPGMSPALHYKVAVVQADGQYHLEDTTFHNKGDGGDLYSNTSREFDDLTAPSSRAYGGLRTQVAAWHISAPGATMTANLDVAFSRPLLRLDGHSFVETNGDFDYVPDPGETVNLYLTTINLWKPTSDIHITVSCSSPAVSFSNNSSYIPSLETNGTSTNSDDLIRFSVAAGSQPTIADFYVNYQCEGGTFTFAETLHVDIGPKQVLLVDGDANYMGGNYQSYYVAALETLRVPYAVHDKRILGSPGAGILQQYPMVLWWTGNRRSDPVAVGDSLLPHADVIALQSFLQNGGRLFLTGQGIARQLSLRGDSAFSRDYLGVRYAESAFEPIFTCGFSGDPVGDGVTLVIQGVPGNQHQPDNLTSLAGASPSFRYSSTYPPQCEGAISAVTYAKNNFKVAFWGFGWEAVNSDVVPEYNVTREQVLSRVLLWLIDLQTGILDDGDSADAGAGENGVPSRFTLFQSYPNPFNDRTIIEYTIAAGGPAQVKIDVFDILGRKVTTLADGISEPGRHQVAWNGTDKNGQRVSSGVYFYRVSANDGFVESRRMVYLK